jgi:hypothetical protein
MKMLLLCLVVGCSKLNQDIVQDLKPYVELFKTEAKDRGVLLHEAFMPTTISFGYTGPTQQAYCHWSYTETYIVVNKSLWDDMSVMCKERLIMHEMAHCTLGKRHNDDYTSIMYATQDYTCNSYNINTRSSLLDNLFLNN